MPSARRGCPALLVCSASDEQPDLVELADIVVDGPAGMVELLGDAAPSPLIAGSTSWTRCAHRETALPRLSLLITRD